MAKIDPSNAFILSKEGKFVVRPAVATVNGQDLKFKIRNLTEFYEAKVTLPASRVEQRTPYEHKIKPNEDFTFKLWKQNGAFEYIVVVGDQRAQGESDPVIIIDPPA